MVRHQRRPADPVPAKWGPVPWLCGLVRFGTVCTAMAGVQCAPGQDHAGSTLRPFTSSLVRDMDLESGHGPPVMSVSNVAPDSAGNLFVLDGMAGKLHKYTASGAYVGSAMDPDGESVFRQPAGPIPVGVVVGGDGNVYVGGAPQSMFDSRLRENAVKAAIARVSPNLAIDTVFTIRGPESVGLSGWRTELAVVLGRPRDGVERMLGLTEEEVLAREELLLMTYDGVLTTAFHPADERKHGIPYWGEWFTSYAVAAGDDLLVVSSLYPVYRYGPDGELVDTFGSASASFRQPSRPEPREFPTWDARKYEWLSSFTTIGGIHVVADSLVVVVLQDRNADEPAVAEWSYRADVFDLQSGEVVARDVGLEGPVVHADTLLYVTWRPTGDSWHIGFFDLDENP